MYCTCCHFSIFTHVMLYIWENFAYLCLIISIRMDALEYIFLIKKWIFKYFLVDYFFVHFFVRGGGFVWYYQWILLLYSPPHVFSAPFFLVFHKECQRMARSKNQNKFQRMFLSGYMQCSFIRVLDVYNLFIRRTHDDWIYPHKNRTKFILITSVWPYIHGWRIVSASTWFHLFPWCFLEYANLEPLYDKIGKKK